MKLPTNFQFSQASLQDFVDCPRRFQLRYIQRQAWPALESEPVLENERYLQQGALFHHMIQQYLLGVSADRLSAMIRDDDLRRWWENFLSTKGFGDLAGLVGARHPEISLSAPLGGYRLVAKYDLILAAPEGGLVIYDWKTARKHPRRAWLAKRLQTRVYPYLLVKAGVALNQGGSISPEGVEMVYWFADFPGRPTRFPYSAGQLQADEEYLLGLIHQIQSFGDEEFPKTEQEQRCRFCVYRSLCNRGVKAGSLDDMDNMLEFESGEALESGIDLDFEQIAEIEF